MANDVFKSRARLRCQYTNEPYATAKGELAACTEQAPVIPPAATAGQMQFEAQVFARWVRAFGGIVPASLSRAGRFGLHHVTPRPHELELRVDPSALTDLLAVLVRHDSQVRASYGVPGLRFHYKRQRLVLRQAGREGRIVLSPVPEKAWAAVLKALEADVPARSRLLLTGPDEWTQDELNYQDQDEDELGASAAYLSSLLRRPALWGDQELRLRLSRDRRPAVVDAAGRPLSLPLEPSTAKAGEPERDPVAGSAGDLSAGDCSEFGIRVERDNVSGTANAGTAGGREAEHVLGRDLLQEVVCAALERHEDVVGWGISARGGDLFALVDPGQLDPDTAAQLREGRNGVVSVIAERDGLLREMPWSSESGDHLRITAGAHLEPVAAFSHQERDAAAVWLIPLDFTHDTPRALFEVLPPAGCPVRRMRSSGSTPPTSCGRALRVPA
ncbi:hypothetical protein O1L68_39865 [Streptomyces lydicus]|nr:hypothetical protein [Streptomyces lydicus]